MYLFPKRLSIESSITHGALVFLLVEPVDNEKDVAVEAEALELEVEEDNDDESVELEEDDDENDMSTRESHSTLIGGTSVLKSSIAKKGRGENSVFVMIHWCWRATTKNCTMLFCMEIYAPTRFVHKDLYAS